MLYLKIKQKKLKKILDHHVSISNILEIVDIVGEELIVVDEKTKRVLRYNPKTKTIYDPVRFDKIGERFRHVKTGRYI